MKKLLFLFFAFTITGFAQMQKTIIIPKQLQFQKNPEQYQINTLCKLFFEKEGFQVFFDTDEKPKEISVNPCNVYYLQGLEHNTLLKTKISFEIRDCFQKILVTSEIGESREKDLLKAYNEASRIALTSFRSKWNILLKRNDQQSLDKQSEPILISDQQISVTKLFAIPTSNGFKIVDTTPKTIYELFNTSVKNVFIAKKDTINGVFIQKESNWFFEYYEDEKLVSEKVEVKF